MYRLFDRSGKASRRPARSRPLLEPLETRTLLSGNPVANGDFANTDGSHPVTINVAANDLAAIGRTNDAILYGARVVLWVTGDDDSLRTIGPQVPSTSSRDHGEPFAAIFKRYNHDFYAVDPHLFSPAEVVFQNVSTGRALRFGRVEPSVLVRSFFGG